MRVASCGWLCAPILWLAVASAGCGDDDGGGTAGDAAPADADLRCSPGARAEPGLAITSHGAIRGVTDGDAWAYRGIPYAVPPLGERRFAPPAPLDCLGAELAATDFGARCPQLDDDGTAIGEEDCLTLNVWVPAATAAAPRPVMVFIHGGGNVQGSSADPTYDGDELAVRGDVVVVTINYRLGALGFLAHPALAAERPEAVSGNWGVRDQIEALTWVRDEMAAFGGDPGNVTVFGESAGARDICVLLVAPDAAGLFQRAIMQSGGCVDPDAQAAEQVGTAWASAAGCADAADVPTCLRTMPLAAVMATLPEQASVLESSDYQPNVDGVIVPENPDDAIAAGRQHAVPLVIGVNADETGRFAPAIATDLQYKTLVQAQFPAISDAVLAQYPAAAYATPRKAYVALTSDLRFICPARRTARAAAASQTAPVRRYLFTHASTPLGAVHAIELPYVFGSFESIAGYTPTATDLALAESIQGYWTRFARTGDPAGAGAAVWPAYAIPGDAYLELAPTPAAGDGIRTTECDFWDSFVP